MKQVYQKAEMEIVEFRTVDVITTSRGLETSELWASRDAEGIPDYDAFAGQ